MRKIILSNQYDANQIVVEERDEWICNFLLLIGADLYNEETDEYNYEQMRLLDIQLLNDAENGDVEIMRSGELIGKWYYPELFPKFDEENKAYYEIHIDYNSILDNEINSVGDE